MASTSVAAVSASSSPVPTDPAVSVLGSAPGPEDSEPAQSTGDEPTTAVPQQHKSAFAAFLKTIASFTGDLSQLTAPSFLLNGISLTEYSVHWCDYPDLFAAAAAPEEPEERMLAVARWFVSTLYGSYHERCATGAEKKPYNPILGEQFKCRWAEPKSSASKKWDDVHIVVEQVSHHPPITAFHLACDAAGVQVTGHCGQKSKFSGMTIKVEQTGRAKMVLARHGDEEYHLTFPDLIIRGLLTGQMFLELSGTTRIVSSSGMQCSIQFLPKPWFSGDYHHISGTISHIKDPSAAIYSLSGQWITATYWKSSQSQQQVLFDNDAQAKLEPLVEPLDSQSELESRRVWKQCTDALRAQNYADASKFKSEIEDYQRKMRKEREKLGNAWHPQYFTWVEDGGDHLLESASGRGGAAGGRFGTGYWKFGPAASSE